MRTDTGSHNFRAACLYHSALWFSRRKGSIMDAMSDAVEGAEVMLYGVSKRYKESANCRLEAHYCLKKE